MNQERIEKIEFGYEYMDAELLAEIEKFKSFDANYYPIVTVLCSDNRLLMQMEKLTDNSGNINFHVCGTFNEIEDALEKIQFSDAVIVNTLALKIAPEGLYKVLKSVEELGKDVYFILSGWESLPKNNELCSKKLSQIEIEFPFAKIKASRNVFVKKLEGFSFVEEVMEDYIKRICDSFDFIHNVQTEALYKKICGDVRNFREKICLEIQKNQSIANQLQQNMMAKQKRYEITFSQVTVALSDVLERLERMVKNIDVDDALFSLEKENMSAKKRYHQNQNETEREVKKNVYNLILSKIESFKSSVLPNSSLSSRNNLQIDEAMNDLLSTVEVLKSFRFIDSFKLDELEQKIRDTGGFYSNARDYEESVSEILDNVKESLHSKVIGFQFEELTQNELKSVISSLLSKAPKIIDKISHIGEQTESEPVVIVEEEKETESVIKKGIQTLKSFLPKRSADKETIESSPVKTDDSYVLKANENQSEQTELPALLEEKVNEENLMKEVKWNQFCSEIQRLIEYSRNALSVLISENCKITNEEINVKSQNSVTSYFSFIIKSLDSIKEELNKKLNEYGRMDL